MPRASEAGRSDENDPSRKWRLHRSTREAVLNFERPSEREIGRRPAFPGVIICPLFNWSVIHFLWDQVTN